MYLIFVIFLYTFRGFSILFLFKKKMKLLPIYGVYLTMINLYSRGVFES